MPAERPQGIGELYVSKPSKRKENNPFLISPGGKLPPPLIPTCTTLSIPLPHLEPLALRDPTAGSGCPTRCLCVWGLFLGLSTTFSVSSVSSVVTFILSLRQ